MNKQLIEQVNDELSLVTKKNINQQLAESMDYSLLAGGKRIRPILLLTSLNMLGVSSQLGIKTAAAIEMVHTYSLIHDDLPAMDNDDYRRGRLTNHKVYGDATAILAGDALLTDSFNLIALDPLLSDITKVKLIAKLSQSAGSNGMVGGQFLDMEAENRTVSLKELEQIHQHKTGDLITCAIVSAGIIAKASEQKLNQLEQFGRNMGLIFQIKDDILDVEGDFETIGKQVGSDASNHKSTYVSLLGINGAKEKMYTLYEESVQLLVQISDHHTELKDLLTFVVERNK